MKGLLVGSAIAMALGGASACSSPAARNAPSGDGGIDAGGDDGGVGGTDAPASRPVSLAVSVSGNGVVVSNPGSISCTSVPSPGCSASTPAGQTLTLSAVADDNATSFAGWSGACAGAGSAVTCTLTLDVDTAVGATFVPASTSLAVILAGAGSGTIASSPGTIDCTTGSSSGCTSALAQGTVVTLSASPAPSSVFAGWSGGGCSGASSTCTTTIAGLATVTATFTLAQETLTVEPATGGTLVSSPAGIACGESGSACAATFAYGTIVTLTESPLPGWQFAGWASCPGGDISATTCTMTVSAATIVGADYAGVNDSLVVTFVGSGAGTIVGTDAMDVLDIDCPSSNCSADLAYGTVETLTATPATGSTFLGWSGGLCSGTGTCTTTVSDTTTITGTFGLIPESLAASLQGSGSGTITGAGLDCGGTGSTCSTTVPYGEVVLTATPAAGSVFSGWWGACHGASPTTTVDVTGATTCVADFEVAQETLTITAPIVFDGIYGASGLALGDVAVTTTDGTTLEHCTENIDDLYFSAEPCSVTVPYGSSLVLTVSALPDPDTGDASTFYGWWSGPCSGSGACTVVMTADTTVAAELAPSTGVVNLMLVLAAVTSSGAPTTGTPAAQIDVDNMGCVGAASPCQFLAAKGKALTLTTYSEAGTSFYSWTGPCPTYGDDCTFTPSADTTVTASFYSP